MEASPLREACVSLATEQRSFRWYWVRPDESVEESPDLTIFSKGLGRAVSSFLPTLVLYHYRQGVGDWGVYWGPIPVEARDQFGRSIDLSLLATFHSLAAASAFLTGVLQDWWPMRRQGIPEFDVEVQALQAEIDGASPGVLAADGARFLAFLRDCLTRWQQRISVEGEPGQLPPSVTQNEPLVARLADDGRGQARQEELCLYLRTKAFANAPVKSEQTDEVNLVVVVAEGIGAEQLCWGWRVLTDQIANDDWQRFEYGKRGSVVEEHDRMRPGIEGMMKPPMSSKEKFRFKVFIDNGKGFLERHVPSLAELISPRDALLRRELSHHDPNRRCQALRELVKSAGGNPDYVVDKLLQVLENATEIAKVQREAADGLFQIDPKSISTACRQRARRVLERLKHAPETNAGLKEVVGRAIECLAR